MPTNTLIYHQIIGHAYIVKSVDTDMDSKFNPHSPDCSVGMTELQAARWLEKQPGMVMTVQKDGRMALFMEGRLFVKGKGILGAVIAAKKIFDNEKLIETGGCS